MKNIAKKLQLTWFILDCLAAATISITATQAASPAIPCLQECTTTYVSSLATCNGDPSCIANNGATYKACQTNCGIQLTECQVTCDTNFASALASCHNNPVCIAAINPPLAICMGECATESAPNSK